MNPEDYTIKSDNTLVLTKEPKRILFTKELLLKIQWNKLREAMSKSQSTLSDSNLTAYYNNLLKFTNSNAFGNGLLGKLTYYNPSTKEGLQKIKSNFDYAKSNAKTLMENIALTGVAKGVLSVSKGILSITKGAFRTPTKNGALGTLKLYSKNLIGSGSEAVVINNTPTTVGKMTSIPLSEMVARNLIPNTVKSTYIGYVKDRGVKLPTYILDKVKVLTENTFPKYISKLDKSMSKAGFRRVNDPNVLYRAYTNGSIVVDDVSPGNVGLTWFRKPKMIDFNLLTVPEWIALGFSLKYGGKLIPKAKSGWVAYLNPKNWGVTDYDTKEFSEAFAKARLAGDKEFLWNGNRYHTRLIKPESQKSFDDLYKWIKNKINTLTINNVPLNTIDSLSAKSYAIDKDKLIKDSVGTDKYYDNLDYYYYKLRPLNERYYLDSIRTDKINNIKKRFNSLSKKNLIVTDEPKKDYSTMGYYVISNGKMYLNLNSPGTVVHEMAHQSNMDRLHNISVKPKLFKEALINSAKHNDYMYPDYEYIEYSSDPREIGARLLLNLYLLQGKNYLNAKPILERNPVDAVLYNNNNFNTYFKL